MSDNKKSAVVGPSPCANGRKGYVVNGHHFEVPPHYNLHKAIGYGAYGIVCSAVDARNGKKIAVKKCQNVFKDLGDAKRILREIKLQQYFCHENMLGIEAVYVGGDGSLGAELGDVYIVSELYDTDLNTVIRSKQKVSEEHVKYFIYQVLRGLKFMHTAHVMHRDLKPANLLVNVNCDLRICDYGLSRPFDDGNDDAVFTDYVVTRWYRPPELLLMNKRYTTAVDIWSVGCIFVELINRRPLFMGKDYLAQLQLVVAKLGTPRDEELTHIENKEALRYMKNLQPKEAQPMQTVAPKLEPEAYDFLERMLCWDPTKRATADELMAHPYMAALHDPTDEPAASTPFAWEHEHADLTKAQLVELFAAEAGRYSDCVLQQPSE